MQLASLSLWKPLITSPEALSFSYHIISYLNIWLYIPYLSVDKTGHMLYDRYWSILQTDQTPCSWTSLMGWCPTLPPPEPNRSTDFPLWDTTEKSGPEWNPHSIKNRLIILQRISVCSIMILNFFKLLADITWHNTPFKTTSVIQNNEPAVQPMSVLTSTNWESCKRMTSG